jgi:hypothetical protein
MVVRVERKGTVRLPPIPQHPSQVEVGFPRGKASSDIVMHAVWNEFGTRRIPERPFFRRAMRNNRDKYAATLRAAAPSIFTGQVQPASVLHRLGIMAQGDIQHEIDVTYVPPNAPATVVRKGSSHPLIDTGSMRRAVTWRTVF